MNKTILRRIVVGALWFFATLTWAGAFCLFFGLPSAIPGLIAVAAGLAAGWVYHPPVHIEGSATATGVRANAVSGVD